MFCSLTRDTTGSFRTIRLTKARIKNLEVFIHKPLGYLEFMMSLLHKNSYTSQDKPMEGKSLRPPVWCNHYVKCGAISKLHRTDVDESRIWIFSESSDRLTDAWRRCADWTYVGSHPTVTSGEPELGVHARSTYVQSIVRWQANVRLKSSSWRIMGALPLSMG